MKIKFINIKLFLMIKKFLLNILVCSNKEVFNLNNFFVEKNNNHEFINLDLIKGNICSNLVYEKNIYLITEINEHIYMYIYDFKRKETKYIPLNIKNFKNKYKQYKLSVSDNYLCFIDESGFLNIFNILSKKTINISNNFIPPIYGIPYINKNKNKLEIYIFHGYDILSYLLINNLKNSEENYKIYRNIIHQQPYYNNIYCNFNDNISVAKDFLVFSSKDGYIYVYKNNEFLLRKHLNNNNLLVSIINMNNHYYMFINNPYKKILLYDLEGKKIWEFNCKSILKNIYYKNYFFLLDTKHNLYVLNKKGEEIFSKNILDIIKKHDKFSHIFNYFIINNKVIFLTDKGIFIFDNKLKTYKIIYLNINYKENHYINNKNNSLFFISNNKLFKVS